MNSFNTIDEFNTREDDHKLSTMNVSKECRRVPLHSYAGKEVVSSGPVWFERPMDRATCIVFVSYIYVDESVNREHSVYFKPENDVSDLTVVLGEADCDLDRGLEKALCQMSAGEESKVSLVQDNSSSKEMSVFVKLIKFQNKEPVYKWSNQEKIKYIKHHKEKGNLLYGQNRVIDAFHRFNKAIKMLITIYEGGDEVTALYVSLCSNLALCQSRLKNFEYVISLCKKVLTCDKSHLKCLIRRMDAYVELRDFEKAFDDVKKILELDPENIHAKKKLIFINKNLAEQEDRYVEMVKRMFVTSST